MTETNGTNGSFNQYVKAKRKTLRKTLKKILVLIEDKKIIEITTVVSYILY